MSLTAKIPYLYGRLRRSQYGATAAIGTSVNWAWAGAARSLGCNATIFGDDLVAVHRDERHALVVQVATEYHCKHGPVELWPRI